MLLAAPDIATPAAGEVGMGVKLVTFYPGNAERGLPTHLAMILLFRPETTLRFDLHGQTPGLDATNIPVNSRIAEVVR